MFLERMLEGYGKRRTLELAKMFYGDDFNGRDNYVINEETGLNYFGEYLERHTQNNISVKEIMCAVGYRPKQDFSGYQIYDGQLELFLERVEKEREENPSLELDLLTIIFLEKMKEEEKKQVILKKIVDELKLDNGFLFLTYLIFNSYIKLDSNIRAKVVKLLNEEKFDLNVDFIINKFTSNSYFGFNYVTELPMLKDIVKVYGLKKSDFKNNDAKLESCRALKKFGTPNTDIDLCNEVLDLDAQTFYLVAIKVANETYADGSGKVKANQFLIEALNRNMNVNSTWYPHLKKICLRVKGGMDKDVFDYKYLDFSIVEKEYFDTAIYAFNEINSLKYEILEPMVVKEDFIGYIEEKSVIGRVERNLIIEIIHNISDNTLAKRYYDTIKEYDNFSIGDIAVFAQKGLVDMDIIYNNIFRETREGVEAREKLAEMMDTCVNRKLSKILLSIIKMILEKEVVIPGFYWRVGTFSRAVDFIEYNCIFKEDASDDEKVTAYKLLNDFVFMYMSAKYYKWILKHINSDVFKKALDIKEDDVKAIGQYLIEKDYIANNYSDKSIIEKLIFDEQDLLIDSCKKLIRCHIRSVGINSKHENDVDINAIKENLESIKNKIAIKDFYKEEINELKYSYHGDAVFMELIKNMRTLNLIDEQESVNFIKDRIESMIG